MSAKRSHCFCVWLTMRMAVIALPAFAVASHGQTIVPIAPQFPAPMGLTFRGDWRCSDENSSATLKVRSANSAGGSARPRSGWASIEESEEGEVGRFYVGYDRGRKLFMLIDAEDPAYAAYQTDGWLDGKLTLTAVNRSAPADRCVYEVKGSREFTVVWQSLEGAAWVGDGRYTCRKLH